MFFETSIATSILVATAGWLPTGIRWNTAQLPIPYCISANATRTSVNAQGQRTAVLQGINAWVATNAGGSLSCTTYTAVASNQACQTQINGGDQRYNVFWEDNWRQGSGTIGVTWSTGSGQACGRVTDDTGQQHNLGCKFDSDIEFNDVNFTWTTSGQGGTDIASITAHEYGHFIGLDHCSDNNTCNFGGAIMYASYGGGAVRVPFADDIQGACALYPGTQGGLGWACNNNGQCTNNICINPGATGYCSQTCGTCPQGYACGPNPQNANQQVCLRDDGNNRGLCEECALNNPSACANGGLCMRGLPEQTSGRCVTPCNNGQCDANYQCLQVQFQGGGTGNFCFPRSNDCNDPGNFTELDIGQSCNPQVSNPACRDGLTCVGICAPSCNPGTCPAGWGCEAFQSGESYCLPEVGEGENCQGLVSCTIGPCLGVNGRYTCFQDCAGNPGVCNAGQTCETYQLSNGTSVSVCDPAGAQPPPPDGGVLTPDTGTVGPQPDSGVNPQPDGGVNPQPDGGVTPQPDAGSPPMICECDTTFACDPAADLSGDCACDIECLCECDQTFVCDRGCEACDPECEEGAACGCTETEQKGLPWAFLALLPVLFRRRRA